MTYLLGQLGSILAGAGIVWVVYVATQNLVIDQEVWRRAADKVMAARGPLEVCAVGVVLWLLGKWRHATRMNH